MGKEVGGGFKERGTYVYLWLVHVDVWQKPSQYFQVIILYLKHTHTHTHTHTHKREKGNRPWVFTQKVRPLTQVVAYVPKQSHRLIRNGVCLWAVAATTTPLRRLESKWFAQLITIWTLLWVQALVSSKGTG